MPVHIVTDSSADLSSNALYDLNVSVIPANIIFGRRKYRDGLDITPKEFYEKLAGDYFQPVTTPASPLEFYKAFAEQEEQGNDILVITLPDSLSGFQESARIAAKYVNKVDIHILNSGGLSGHQGLLVVLAARLAKQGYSLAELVARISEVKQRTHFYALVPKFDQLIRSGRVPAPKGMLGKIIGFTPLLTMEDEVLKTLDTPRGFEKGYKRILDELKTKYQAEEPVICVVLDGLNPSAASRVEELIRENFNVSELLYAKVGATIGANAGSGTVGLAIAPDIF
ncbi:MAG: DegV family protein [Candidatus Heimdallarchaeota archaeon]|nr:DegV family protein [Candidatus Heimdallarchaeota archaeon]